jgi:predicted transglutaminase-like cysteine proteinase
MKFINLKLSALCLVLLSMTIIPAQAYSATSAFHHLFGYKDNQQNNMNYLPQWLSVLERHLRYDVPEGNCTDSFFNTCHLKNWLSFLDSIKSLSRSKQMAAVNRYANNKKYVLDINNYGMEDYWAVAKEFLYNGGDCEDYSITKFFSLRWLGFSPNDLRIVILQDTNLQIPHAILAVSADNDVLILDNQTQQVLSHRRIAHYIPLYSVNEKKWWLHIPPM